MPYQPLATRGGTSADERLPTAGPFGGIEKYIRPLKKCQSAGKIDFTNSRMPDKGHPAIILRLFSLVLSIWVKAVFHFKHDAQSRRFALIQRRVTPAITPHTVHIGNSQIETANTLNEPGKRNTISATQGMSAPIANA